MKRAFRIVLASAVAVAAIGALAVASMFRHGLSARDEPSGLETWMARAARRLATPREAAAARNPVPLGAEALARARAHFADHCASCHGNDGRGSTQLGQSLYPKAPDMTLPATQRLSDGEIFFIIGNGVRLTGMPAWGAAGADDDAETWELVHFIRHLPRITPEELAEMEELNPKSRRDLEEEESIRKFLAGRDAEPSAGSKTHEH